MAHVDMCGLRCARFGTVLSRFMESCSKGVLRASGPASAACFWHHRQAPSQLSKAALESVSCPKSPAGKSRKMPTLGGVKACADHLNSDCARLAGMKFHTSPVVLKPYLCMRMCIYMCIHLHTYKHADK